MNQTLRYVLQNARKHWPLILLGTGLLIVTNLIGVLIPMRIRSAVDGFSADQLHFNGALFRNLCITAGLALVMAIMRIGSRLTLFGFGRQIESEQKQKFYEHLLTLDLQYFNSQRIGDLISRATSDVQAIRLMMGFGLLNIINIVWVYSFTLPLMFSLNAMLTCITLLSYIPLLYGVYLLSLKLKVQQQLTQEELGSLSSFIEEDLNGIQVIKSYSQEAREVSRFAEINARFLDVSTKLAQWRSVIWPMMELARGLGFFVLFAFAALGKVGAGTAAALLVCLERLVFPVAITGWLISIFQRGGVSVQRLQEVYTAQPQILNRTTGGLVAPTGRLEVRDLHYSYDDTQVLTGLNMSVPPNSFVGIVGLIGSGKSTLCNAVVRLIDTPVKTVYIDGQDITTCSIEAMRATVGMVTQETILFNASVQENIGFGGEYTQEQIHHCARVAQIHDEITGFSQGYATVVGERGVSLSGGQAQRIALARAIIRRPQILILDDALSSVDNEIGLQILRNIRQEFAGRTLILVTHRLSSLRDADCINIFEGGQCVGSGKHAALLEGNEVYRELWREESLNKA